MAFSVQNYVIEIKKERKKERKEWGIYIYHNKYHFAAALPILLKVYEDINLTAYLMDLRNE